MKFNAFDTSHIVLVYFTLGFRITAFPMIIEVWRFFQLSRYGARTSGEIIESEKSVDNDGLTTYTPVIRYHVNGTMFHLISTDLRRMELNVPGIKIEILYNTSNPHIAIACTSRTRLLLFIKIIFCILMLLLLTGFIWYFI
jgi:dipeptide/tripeptide permease